MDLKQFCQIAEYDHPLDDFPFEEKLSTEEALELVMESIPPSLRNDFLRMANGVSIQSNKRKNVIDAIKEILGEDW